MPQYYNIEWLNACSQRAYPFAEHSTRKDKTRTISIPDSFLLELYLPVAASAEMAAESFFMSSLSSLGGGYIVEISYDDQSPNPPVVATCSIPSATFTEYRRYALVGINLFEDTYGKIVVGSLAELNSIAPGTYLFDPDDGSLDPDTIRPMIRGVSSLAVSSGGSVSQQLRNNVVLTAGANIRLSTTVAPGQDPEIRIDAIPGDGFTKSCGCVPENKPCIRTINGIGGDSKQNFFLSGDNCIHIASDSGGLKLTDKCCQPCCGPTELAEVVRVLRNLQEMSTTLDSYSNRLGTQVNALQTTILSSRIGAGTVLQTDQLVSMP